MALVGKTVKEQSESNAADPQGAWTGGKPGSGKHRQSQDHIGELLGNSKEIQYRPVDIEGMDAEWVSVNRAHMKSM